jgi:pimeloyl-ACP methyl ester carboxylesterase
LDDYARLLAAVLQKLDLGQPYAVLGHSNGGALAIRAISMEQLQPQKLILLAAAGIRTPGARRRWLLQIVAKTGNAATIWMPERYRQRLRRTLYGTAGSDMLAVPHMQETFKKTVRQDVQRDAASLRLPVLLIYAVNDRAVPLEYGDRYHKLIEGSRLEVIKDAGHFVHLDQPVTVAKLIKEFLT